MFTVTSIYVFHLLNYYKTSLQIFLVYKFFWTNLSQVELEILRNSSTILRSSHQGCSIKKAILKNVAIVGKHLCWGLFFNKVADHQTCIVIKKRLQHTYFLLNIRKFIGTPILKNICEQLHFWKVFCKNIFQSRT